MSFATSAEATASYRRQTRARTGEAGQEDGIWCVVAPSDGHQWEWHDGEWVRMTDRDDAYVQEVARLKKKKARD